MRPASCLLVLLLALTARGAAAQPPRRFIIDSHLHYRDQPDFIETLVRTYRPRNAMACVLTPYRHFEKVRAACGVPEPSRRRIYGETMARILGIPVRP